MTSTETKCIYDMYGCKTGSTIYLKVATDSDCVVWKFNGEKVESKVDLRKGFEKKAAVFSDTGKYTCIVENEERFVFDVVVYENYETFDCKVRSTIHLKVHTDSKLVNWTLNGKGVTCECNPQLGFVKQKAVFEDSGRYECTVDEAVIYACDVVVSELYECRRTIEFDVYTDPSRTSWIVNGEYVKSRYYQMGRIFKFVESYKDLGRYICKVDGRVTYAFDVIWMDHVHCKIGSTINLKVETRTIRPAWTLNGEEISQNCSDQIVLEKENANFSDSGMYEWKFNGTLRCVFRVIIFEDYVFEIGSDVYLKINSDSDCPEWFFEGSRIHSECGPQIGFKKKTAVHGDSGQYEGIVENIVKYTFNVTLHENIDIKIGSTLHLLEKTCYFSHWTFNGKKLQNSDKSERGFEKRNVDFSDSGRYEYIEHGAVYNVFDVVVYGSCQKYECKFGSTLHLQVNSYTCCPKWTFNGKDVLTECCPHEGFEKKNLDFRDTGIYRCKIGGNVTHMFDVIVYDYLFGDEFLGIRITVPGEGSGEKPEILSKSEPKQSDKPGSTSQQENTTAKKEFSEYEMNRKPRGIAVIICIGKFERKEDLNGMKRDAENCKKVFKSLHFDAIICDKTKKSEIDDFLTKIADKIQEDKEYDCFVLLFGSHGGNGYICCSDFDDTKETGFIHIHGLLKKFHSLKRLEGKPKIFFFDSCRHIDKVSGQTKLRSESDIERRLNGTEISKHYGDSLIGYGAIKGTGVFGTEDGGFFTQQLIKRLWENAKTMSFIELVTQVSEDVKNEAKKYTIDGKHFTQVTAIRSTLSRRIIMKHLE